MTTATAPVAGPAWSDSLLHLFDEDKHGDRQAREALFCTFNADLGYFERSVLGVTQSTGARVTVVGDGRISDPDPRAVRNAGTRYVHGLAVTDSGAAFHPKVTVVAGRERAVVAIGSGNLSPGGWDLNKETWTVAAADRERCPIIVTEVAAWLRTLEAVCAITPQAAEGIGRTATHLEELAAAATAVDTGHRLVHTSTASLIEQLPDGEVDRLLLYAPFHDERAEAVHHLIERFLPNRVTLAVQSGERTVIQPDAVRRVAADWGVEFDVIEDAEERYRHGKLIEAIGPNGSRWTLTGSPNLSARALLQSAVQGGNIEVGVVSRPDASLFPEGRPIALSEVAAVRIDGPAISRPVAGATLLGAVRAEGGLEVVFSKPLAETTRIMASAHADFDQWAEAGLAPAGATVHVLAGVDLPGGARIRCEWGAGTEAVVGGIVFVIDPDQVMRRPGETAPRGGVDPEGPAALITDPRQLELWLSALVVGDDTNPDGIAGLASDEFRGFGVDYFRDLAAKGRGRVRRRLEASVATEMQGYPAFGRLAILTLVLCAVQAELWDGPLGDQGWIRVVCDALEKLDHGDIPEQLSGTVASWAALATYLLHEHRPTTGRTAEALMYEKASDSVSHLFPEADGHLVADLAAPFTNKNGYPVDPDAIMDLIGMVVQADPLSEAIDILEVNHPAWRVDRHNGVLLHVDGEFRGTFLPAAEALDAVPGTEIAAVLATGTTAGWTIAIRDEGSFIRVEKNPTGQVTWWHYTLSNLITPTGIARGNEFANRARKKYPRLDQPFPAALEALAKAEIDLSGDAPSRCPTGLI